MLRQDLLKRAIEQLAAALARAMGYRASGQDLQALECLNEAKGALPLVPGMLDDLDAAALLAALGHEAARALATVLAEEAALHEAAGRSVLAARRRSKSEQLLALLERGSPPG
jgi:hypothetical protein